jgi:hypothetical protein
MPVTRRAQILMDPEEYRRLEVIARHKQVAVAELIRRAVREKYLLEQQDRRRLVEEICGMELPVGDWEDMEAEIEDAHTAGLP